MILGNATKIQHPRAWVLHRIHTGQFHAMRIRGQYVMTAEQIIEARKSIGE